MLKDLTKVILTAKATIDLVKEKLESKATDLAIQVKGFVDKRQNNSTSNNGTTNIKEKAKEELFQFVSEITHRAQINEVYLKGLLKDKLIELTNNALLDSTELNDIRAEIASLRAEIADIKVQLNSKPAKSKSWFNFANK